MMLGKTKPFMCRWFGCKLNNEVCIANGIFMETSIPGMMFLHRRPDVQLRIKCSRCNDCLLEISGKGDNQGDGKLYVDLGDGRKAAWNETKISKNP